MDLDAVMTFIYRMKPEELEQFFITLPAQPQFL